MLNKHARWMVAPLVGASTLTMSACGNASDKSNVKVSVSSSASPSAKTTTSSSSPTSSATSTTPVPTSASTTAVPSVAATASAPSVTVTQSAPTYQHTTDAVRTMPGATKALRISCIDVNNKLVDTNTIWNQAARSKSSADIAKAVKAMAALATQARSSARDSGNTAFSQKATALAAAAQKLTDASGTLNTTDYNARSSDVTSYCGGMFPKA